MKLILNWFLMILPFALWGTSMAAMTPLVSSAGPEFVASLRLLPAGILVLITTYLLKRDLKIYRCDLKWFIVFTIVDATFFQLFLTYGISKTGAGLGSVLIDSQPLIVALLARVIFGNIINPIGWLGLLFGLGGIIFLGFPQEFLEKWWLMSDTNMGDIHFNVGEAWMLAAALSMALGTILIRLTCTKSDPVSVTGWHMVFGSFPLIFKYYLQTDFQLLPVWSLTDWGLMAFASIFGSAVAYGLFFYFANSKEITGFSTLAFLTPVFALISGGLWLEERLTLLQWVGVVFVLFSVFFVSQRQSLWEISNSESKV
tara:strand:- start:4445 stop:5386 length:942 start_codon:yes stop_codon:yes gene_type:complete